MIDIATAIERGYDKLDKDFENVPRASNAGECALRLWARYKGKEDIPITWDTKITRFALGHAVGEMLARFLEAGLEDAVVDFEPEIQWQGLVGHIDALITYGNGRKHVVEFKSSYYTKGIEAKPFQELQAAIYATAVGAPTFSVFILAPAVENRGGPKPKHQQFDYDTADFAAAVAKEVARMKTATHDEPPQPDPDAAWRCAYCAYSGCSRNTNPAKKVAVTV